MAKRTRDLISETKQDMSDLEVRLQDALSHRDRAQADLDNARRRLKRKNESTAYPNRLREAFVKAAKANQLFQQELIAQIDNAIEKNPEFENQVYRTQLYQVANDESIYRLIFSGDGWQTILTPMIIFEEEAGNLTDWARGIDLYREVLGVDYGDEGSNAGAKATVYWFDNIYGTARQDETLKQRINYAGRLAPFWQILAFGSQPMTSDRPDGSYNPLPADRTDFVDNAERSIRALFAAEFEREKEAWFREAQSLREEIEAMQRVRDEYSDQVTRLRTEAKLNTAVYNRLGSLNQYVDKNKLAEAIRKYRAGEEFERPTVELTRSGAEKRVRMSVRRLEGLIYD